MKFNPFVVMREEFDGTGIVFNSDNNKVMTLNATGVALWKAFAQGADRQSAIRTLSDQFEGAAEEQLEKDVREFQEELVRRSLLVEE